MADYDAGSSPGSSPSVEPHETLVIEARKGWRGVDWKELYHYRELLFFLVWRDVKVRYKMAIFGFAWAVAVPVLSMLVYGAVGMAAGLAEEVAVPYFLWMLAGLLPWQFIQRGLSDGGQSLVNHASLMSKIYMPRLFIPASSCGGALVDLAISLGVMVVLAAYYASRGSFVPGWHVLAVVPLLLLTLMATLGTAILLSALTVLYRDLRFLIPFLSQFGLWLSGVVFPTSVFGKYEVFLAINPYAGLVSGWRSALVGAPWNWPLLAGSIILSPILLWVSVRYFRRVERRFADIA